MSESAARDAARLIVDMMQSQYSAPSTMIPVSEADFAHLDLAAYRFFLTELEASGFRHVADLEMLEVSQSPTTLLARTMIRSMISEDGWIVSDYYQIRPRIWRYVKLLAKGLLNMRVIDAPRAFAGGMQTRHCSGFETEFDDGSFLMTSNAQAASLISGPPTIENNFYPYGTPPSLLLQAHRARLTEILDGKADVKPVVVSSLSDILQMQSRQSAQKAAHRAASQWITKAELQGMSAGNTDIADEVFSEVQKLLKNAQSVA